MDKQMIVIRILAIFGTLLVWFPLLITPVVSALLNGLTEIDFLLPAQLFIIVFMGAAMLIGAAYWMRQTAKPLIIVACSAFGVLLFGQIVAGISARTVGITTIGSVILDFINITVIIYILAVIVLGVMGIVMTVNLFRDDDPPDETKKTRKIKKSGKTGKPKKLKRPKNDLSDDDFDNTPII